MRTSDRHIICRSGVLLIKVIEMKNKRNAVATVLLLTMLMTSCASSGSGQHISSTTSGVQDVLESRMAEEDGSVASDETTEASADQSSGDSPDVSYQRGEVQIDLSNMNSDMLYANVFGMVSSPADYEGVTVRMKGTAISAYDEATGNTYYACFISDAAACCSQGLEYYLSEGEYPEDDEEITVVGVFTTYYEGENMYVALMDAVLE